MSGQKTEYRIITLRTFIADRYLQFKSVQSVRCFPWFWRKRRVECWRLIPKDTYAYVLGYCLNEQSCPTSLHLFQEDKFLHSLYDREWDLNSFAERYPRIQAYLDELSSKRDEYLRGERSKNTAERSGEVTHLS